MGVGIYIVGLLPFLAAQTSLKSNQTATVSESVVRLCRPPNRTPMFTKVEAPGETQAAESGFTFS